MWYTLNSTVNLPKFPQKALSTEFDESLSAGAKAMESLSSGIAEDDLKRNHQLDTAVDPLTAALLLPVPHQTSPKSVNKYNAKKTYENSKGDKIEIRQPGSEFKNRLTEKYDF